MSVVGRSQPETQLSFVDGIRFVHGGRWRHRNRLCVGWLVVPRQAIPKIRGYGRDPLRLFVQPNQVIGDSHCCGYEIHAHERDENQRRQGLHKRVPRLDYSRARKRRCLPCRSKTCKCDYNGPRSHAAGTADHWRKLTPAIACTVGCRPATRQGFSTVRRLFRNVPTASRQCAQRDLRPSPPRCPCPDRVEQQTRGNRTNRFSRTYDNDTPSAKS